MNTNLVNTAAGVIHAAMEQGRATAASLAYALESAQLLQSPETAAELARLRADRDAFRDQRNGAFQANERLISQAQESAEAKLRAENATRTAQREIARLRARVAELEAAAEKVAAFCAERAEYVTNLRDCVDADGTYYRWTGHAAARRELSKTLGLPVGWPSEDAPVIAAMAAAPVEDPHDSPLHHAYTTGRDLPEVPRA
ncbi:hypothetical protein GTW69_30650 [Streptomyces sp. SID7760]|nr:hypothetical protein [Streptomyces sp. SID7760]